MYRLNLLAKMKIYPIQYIAILEPVYRDIKLLVYKVDIYRGQEEASGKYSQDEIQVDFGFRVSRN